RRHTRSIRDWSSDVCSSDLKFARLRGPQQIGESALSKAARVVPAGGSYGQVLAQHDEAVGRRQALQQSREHDLCRALQLWLAASHRSGFAMLVKWAPYQGADEPVS